MKKLVVIIILIIFSICGIYFASTKYKNEFSEVFINSSGIYKSTKKEEGRWEIERLITHLLGSKTEQKPEKYYSQLEITEYDFEFKLLQKNIYDCGYGQSMNFIEDNLIFKDFILLNSRPNMLLINKRLKTPIYFPNREIFVHVSKVDYTNNALCFINNKSEQYILNFIFLNDNKKNIAIVMENMPFNVRYDLIDYYNNIVLLSQHNKDIGRMTNEEVINLKYKSILGYIENNTIRYVELPIVTEEPGMIPIVIGKKFIVYYNYLVNEEFSYKVYDLDAAKFSIKFTIKANGLKHYKGNFHFNKENNIFLIKTEKHYYYEDEVLLVNLYSNTGKAKLLENFK